MIIQSVSTVTWRSQLWRYELINQEIPESLLQLRAHQPGDTRVTPGATSSPTRRYQRLSCSYELTNQEISASLLESSAISGYRSATLQPKQQSNPPLNPGLNTPGTTGGLPWIPRGRRRLLPACVTPGTGERLAPNPVRSGLYEEREMSASLTSLVVLRNVATDAVLTSALTRPPTH
ncbi:unnamed protein product [Gadus morhua 'NCC']